MEITVNTRLKRSEVMRIVNACPQIATGQSGWKSSLQKVMLVRMGLAALHEIAKAFVTKSRGGTDEAGLKWKPLSPLTIAYKRRHPGLPFPGKKRAPKAPSWMLTEKQRKRWWALYRGFAGMKPGGAAYHKDHSNDMAAARAWKILKSEGAKTILGEYGNTQVEILRDKGQLLTSLSPGTVPDAAGPTPPSVPLQVFRTTQAEVIVGTRRKWCSTHHHGTRTIPKEAAMARASPVADTMACKRGRAR